MNTLDFILDKYKVHNQPLIELDYTRFEVLPDLFKELDFKSGAEIGVSKGNFSRWISDRAPVKIYAVDAWDMYKGYVDVKTQKDLDLDFEDAKARLEPCNVEIIKDYSMNAVKKFEDESLDFVFIDSNHAYESVKEDIMGWSKKVKKGGIISGHDYLPEFGGVVFGTIKAVDEWVKENNISPLFILVKKDSGEVCPSWMYIK